MAFARSLCAREMWRENSLNTKTLVFNIVVLAGFVAMCGTTSLLAQSPSFSDFSSIPNPNLVLNGNWSKVNNNVLRLTPAQQSRGGSAWFAALQPVAEGFSTTFTFQITPPAQNPDSPLSFPADGIAFVIQNSSEMGTSALGGLGGSIGYGGINNSLAIEFDTFANSWDPEFVPNSNMFRANHVAIQSCGTGVNTSNHATCEIAISPAPVDLSKGPHTVQIEYTPAIPAPPNCIECSFTPAALQVTIDGLAVFDGPVEVDLTRLLTLAQLPGSSEGAPLDSAYVGFTAATGDFVENNDILSWTFTPHASQTIIQNNLPPNVFTTYNFGSYLYKVRPDKAIDTLAVTAFPTDSGAFDPGPNFRGAQCIVYDSTGGKCVEFHASCSSNDPNNNACNNVNYDVVTSYDVPTVSPINNPGFLKATNQDCPPARPFDSNIITAFTQTRADPTTKGKSKPSFSCFVAAQGLTYQPADLDIVNLASAKVKPNGSLTYVAIVADFGPVAAQGVAITNTIPAGTTTYVSSALCSLTGGCSNASCIFDGSAVSCVVGDLPRFGLEFLVVTVKVTAPLGTIISDTATVTAFNPDPDKKLDRSWTMKTIVSNK